MIQVFLSVLLAFFSNCMNFWVHFHGQHYACVLQHTSQTQKARADTNARLFFQSKIASINLWKQVQLHFWLISSAFSSWWIMLATKHWNKMFWTYIKLLEQPNMLTVLTSCSGTLKWWTPSCACNMTSAAKGLESTHNPAEQRLFAVVDYAC